MDDHVACLGCGYDLRGLDDDGDCPECGHPVAESREAPKRVVTRREFAIIVIRMMALWLVMQMMFSLIGFAQQLVSLASGSSGPTEFAEAGVAGILVLSLTGALWHWAPAIASRMVPHDGRAFDGSFYGPDVVLRLGCVLLGLYFVVTGVAGLVGNAVAMIFVDAQMSWYLLHNLPMSGLRAVLGLVIMLGARRLVRLVGFARTFATQK